LVKRPQKNFLWGYGTSVFDENKTDDENCFTHGEIPTIRELLNFLEIYQMKDMKVVNLKALGKNMENYAIICSGFSMRHLYSTSKTLVQKLKALECSEIKVLPTICGCKDDSWLMITVKEVQVHLILDEYREELDLEFRWMNPPPPEMRKKWKTYENLKRRGQSLEVDEKTFEIKNAEEWEYYKP
jgi:ribosomal silencing factor RsfS